MISREVYQTIVDKITPLYGQSESESIAAIVLEDAFGVKRFALSQDILFEKAEKEKLEKIIARLLASEPVQYVLGETQFFGLKFKVDESVLIPRQETEELVAWILDTLRHRSLSPLRVLDIGTGSGCIPVTLKYKRQAWEVHALDVSEDALVVAKENSEINNAELIFHQVDILDEDKWSLLPDFDVIVSNPPYITESEKGIMPPQVLNYEPHLALFTTDGDAQQFIKKITAFTKRKLITGGYLFFETNEFFGKESQGVMEAAGLKQVELRKDLNQKDRMLRGQLIQ